MKTKISLPAHTPAARHSFKIRPSAALTLLATLLIQFAPSSAWGGVTTTTFSTVGTTPWTCPPGVTTISVAVQGGGGVVSAAGGAVGWMGPCRMQRKSPLWIPLWAQPIPPIL